jgi:energy-coupling factor transporter ATP-binding protein EcfA2
MANAQLAEQQPWRARLLDSEGRTAGSGFLVDDRHVLTCAHVVARQLGINGADPRIPNGIVGLDFPAVPSAEPMQARVSANGWFPPNSNGGDDIAVLELTAQAPLSAIRAPLRTLQGGFGHHFRCFGFPEGLPHGLWIEGTISGRAGPQSEWVQLQVAGSVPAGFSGSAIYDDTVEAVVGMLVAVTSAATTTAPTAWMLPVDALIRAWPSLDEQIATQSPAQTPPDITPFIGQQEAIQQVTELLESATYKTGLAVVITGRAGAGKSALAVHMAHAFQSRFHDGQLYALLDGHEASDILAEFLRSLGVQDRMIPDAEQDRVRLYRDRLAKRRILVLLDGAKTAAQVRPLLPAVEGCAALITSQSSLPELAGAHHVTLAEFSTAESLEFLSAIVGSDRVEAEPTAAAELVRICDYLPLAIILVAARLVRHPGETIQAVINSLEREPYALTADPSSVRTVFTISYEALTNEEARLFRFLGLVTAPDFDASVAAALLNSSVGEARDLLAQLQAYQFVESTADPGHYSLHSLLRSYARERLYAEESEESRQDAATRLQTLPSDRNRDQVEWVTDSPATRDLLKRKSLAWALASRLRRIQRDDPITSFLLHIDGPWGAGKSTLLNLLRAELEQDWLIVDFDAWRQSKVGPPWWALLIALRQSLTHEFRLWTRGKLRVQEAAVRIRRAGAPYLLALLILLLASSGVFFLLRPHHFTAASIEDIAEVFTAILAAIGTIWVGALVAGRFLLWDSARGAELFEQSNANPMQELASHFRWLLQRAQRPVVFCLDDLDRCAADYVVELLDAIQTLLRGSSAQEQEGGGANVGVYFVVAADGAWIRKSYELAFASFADSVAEPGRPLGYLFLDKLFQLSVPVPLLNTQRREAYVHELLHGSSIVGKESVQEETRALQKKVRESSSEAEIIAAMQQATPSARELAAPVAVEKLTTPDVEASTDHFLQKFASLLGPNPRSVKRFLNTYSMLRTVRTLEGNLVGSNQLALWTILQVRWPSLADYLRVTPQAIDNLNNPTGTLTELPGQLRGILKSSELKQLVDFVPRDPFNADRIRECCGTGGFDGDE